MLNLNEYKRKRYKYLISIGKCPTHPNRNLFSDKKVCKACFIIRSKKLKINYINLKKEGKCTRHCGRNAINETTLCKKCTEINKKQSFQRKINLTKNGKCRDCTISDVVPGFTKCKNCIWRLSLKRYAISLEDGNNRLKEQNYICPLSGRKLEKGINISIDHIVPIGKNRYNKNHPLNNISNLRFVDIEVQVLRKDMTDEKLIKLCKDIVNYNKKKY